MSISVVEAVVNSIQEQNADFPVEILWHGGEPLAVGIDYFKTLIKPFEELEQAQKVTYNIQTNATLINPDWCSFFLKHKFKVGVSIDGGYESNFNRVDWGGNPIFKKILSGISCLEKYNVDFGFLAVVSNANIQDASKFYNFFMSLDCGHGLGINVEELEGVHTVKSDFDEVMILNFWKTLFSTWRENPKLRIREIRHILSYAYAVLQNKPHEPYTCIDPFPTVMWNGDVCLLSPEFGGIKSPKYDNFIVGNLLEESLVSIIQKKGAVPYVLDFISGIEKCKRECDFYTICGGGQASNKYFEHGTTNATETAFCRNSRILPAKAILEIL